MPEIPDFEGAAPMLGGDALTAMIVPVMTASGIPLPAIDQGSRPQRPRHNAGGLDILILRFFPLLFYPVGFGRRGLIRALLTKAGACLA